MSMHTFAILGLFALSAGASAQSATSATPLLIPVTSKWQFRALHAPAHPDTETWHAATVPGVVPLDLLQAGLIADPFFRENERTLQWIGLSDWEYRTNFKVSRQVRERKHQELVFEGLDTFADVYINGNKLLSANNMFRTWRVDAASALHVGDNELRVVLHSAIGTMMPVVKAMSVRMPTVGQVQAVSEEGIATDPYVRKAPYSYGWDWGPRFVNEGIWKPVYLEAWSGVRTERLHILQEHVSKSDAALVAELDVVSDAAHTAQLKVTGHEVGGNGAVPAATRTFTLAAGKNHLSLTFDVPHPSLWYPVGYGSPARYEFDASLTSDGVHETAKTRTGLRSIELRREPDAIGESFTFVINSTPVFAKGADVIPFDSFAPRVTEAQHRDILQSAVDAHMNMVREWGGGYYESDDFYDIADELGLMVWQEFMFGGAQVPGDDQIPGFRDNVRREAEDQVDRLRDHPSIVLWCGNNEVETGWFHWGDRKVFRDSLEKETAVKVWQDYVLVMDSVLAGVVAVHAPEVPYTPSSPHSSYDRMPDIETAGDMHSWQVWGGSAPIADYNKVTPRFMSEYGFQSFPEMQTIRSFALPDDLQLNSPVMLAHQKNNDGNARIQNYMDAEYPKPKDFASFVYVSQVQQAEAIRVAADHLRSSRPRTMGSLYWQLNDCWPVASWSSIDYFGRWKALQFYAKRFYADIAVVPYLHDGVLDISVVNDLGHAVHAQLNITTMDFSGKVFSTASQAYDVPAASAQGVSHLRAAELLDSHSPAATFAWVTLSVAGEIVSERAVYFDHVKNLNLPRTAIEHHWMSDNGKLVLTLSSPVLARNVWISFGNLDARLSDNSFDLLPGRPVTVKVISTVGSDALDGQLKVLSLRDAFEP